MITFLISLQFVINGPVQTAFHTNNGVRYFGVFLGIAGGSANVPAILGESLHSSPIDFCANIY